MKRITKTIRYEIFRLHSKGYSVREIADELDLSEYQVVRVLGY